MRLNDLGQFVSFLIRISTLSPELIRQFAELELVESTLSAKQAGLAKSFASLVETITAALPVIGAATGVIAAIGAAAIIARKQMEANDFGYAVEKTQKEVKALQDLEAESKNVAWQIHDLNKQKASGDFTQQQQIELELLKAQRKVLEDQVKLYRDRVEAAKNHERETAIRAANSLLNPSENDKLYGSTIDQAIISYSFAREKLNGKPDNAGYNRLFQSASDEVLRYVEEINSLIASLNPDSDKDIINALSGKLQEINSLLGVTENTAYDAVAEVKGLIKEAYDAANIEQLGKQSAETISKRMEPALDSFRRKLKYLRADIIRSIGYGYELSEEQTKEYYKWLDAMGYLSGETDEITAKADQLRKDFKAFFAAESPDSITEKSVAARIRQAVEDFQSIRESLNNGSFGNVSMPDNAIELNTDNIKKFKSELEALGQTTDSLKDKTSAIFANWGTFDGVDIAFTPVLHIENEDGSKEPVLLSPDTVNEYISKVLEKAKADGGGELSADLILKVDAAGLDGFDKVRGKIHGLIAAVGDTAEITSMLLNDIAANSEDTAAALLVAGENLEYAIDSAMGYIRNVIGAQLADFASLRNEIENTAKAWDEYQNLIAGGDPSDWANKFEEAYSKAMTDIENGRPDTAAVWGAAKLFFSDEQLAEMGWSLSRAAQELQKGFFKELFSDPEDIEDADKLDIGAKFVNWLNKNKDSLKSASFSVDGSGMFSFIYDSEEALAKELDISTEAVTVLLKAMDAFGVECMRSKEDNDRLIESFKKMFEIVNSTADVIDDDLKDALSNAFGGLTDEELNKRIEDVKTSIGNLGSLQTVLNEFAAGLRLGGMQENHIMDILLNMKENIEEISGTTLTVDENGNITEFNNAITYANDELRTLNEQNPTPSVSLDTSDGEAKAEAFKKFCDTTFSKENLTYPSTIVPTIDPDAYNNVKSKLAELNANASVPADKEASGTRNAPGGVTLVNELGPELISDNGVAYIANGGKPGFTNLNKGAIVFNADETRQIFSRSYPDAEYPSFAGGTSNGQIKRNMITGMMVPGKAFVSQTGYFPTASTAKRNPTAKKSTRETDYTPRSSYDRDYSNYDNYDSYDSYEEEKLTKLDWIETLLSRIQRSISSLEKIASSGFKSLATRTTAATKEIEWLSKEINAQQRAYTRYMQEANAVGLDAYLMGKVQHGDYNIEEYDEQTAELINQYEEWYEKALDCKDAVEDLRLEIAQLYKTMFDNTQTDFENQLAVIEYSANIINRSLDENKARGYLDSVEFYKELSDVEAQSIEKMNEELEALHQRYTEAMESGEIEAYSEEWLNRSHTAW